MPPSFSARFPRFGASLLALAAVGLLTSCKGKASNRPAAPPPTAASSAPSPTPGPGAPPSVAPAPAAPDTLTQDLAGDKLAFKDTLADLRAALESLPQAQ